MTSTQQRLPQQRRPSAHGPHSTSGRPPFAARRAGYVVSITINAAFLYVAHRILTWDWPGFITEDWNDVLPVMTLSLVVTMAVTFLFIWYDPAWFKSFGNILTTAIGLAVAIEMWKVFPFDFTGYSVDWTGLARVVIGVSIVGMIIGIVAETVKLISWLVRRR